MEFRIADTFTNSLAKLNTQEQKAAKTTAFDLQLDPSRPGLSFHRIDKSKDPNFWSIRVNADVRIIVHKTASSFLLCYVDHHDEAYDWAERRRIEEHPKTGAIQIVEVRERVEEIAPRPSFEFAEAPSTIYHAAPANFIFQDLSEDDLARIGVPTDWLSEIRGATEDRYFEIAGHLPGEAAEALLEYAVTGMLPTMPRVIAASASYSAKLAPPVRSAPPPAEWAEYSNSEEPPNRENLDDLASRLESILEQSSAGADAFAHPDSLRRFRTIESREDLEQALAAPWETWSVFLHPSQRRIIEHEFFGPARVAGSAGTGKTVVALHRVARLAQAEPQSRVLLTTFSRPLAIMLQRKLDVLIGRDSSVIPRVTVTPFRGVAEELYQLAFGRRPHAPSESLVSDTLAKAAADLGVTEFTARFLLSEWANVIDAWQLDSADAYADVPRLGRKNRIGAKQRARLWPVFAATRKVINDRGFHTWAQIFADVTAHYAGRERKPFTHIVVDEAQDLGVPELRLLAAIAPPGPDALFFAGDLGQRIFQQPFSWAGLGIDVRGRSQTLKVNYRTSHQIRRAADRLLPKVVRDVDGLEEERFGTVSVFNGPDPVVAIETDAEAEIACVSQWISEAVADGIKPSEIGLFVRTRDQLGRARAAVRATGNEVFEISERGDDPIDQISIGTMHLAKGLEFKAIVVMACDDEVLPLQARIESVADEVDLDDVYETERQLLYVACTRARDRLLVSGVQPGSEFLNDMK
jgi:superfamily I DNA/RNA helicase